MDSMSHNSRLKIEILGLGCPKCEMLEENARKAVNEMNLKVDIVKITDIEKIINYGVMSTPAIVIDGQVKASGKIVDVQEIKKWLE